MPLFMSCRLERLLLTSNTAALLLNTGSLTSKLAQIVKLSATNLTNLVHFDALDVGRLQGEDTLYTLISHEAEPHSEARLGSQEVGKQLAIIG